MQFSRSTAIAVVWMAAALLARGLHAEPGGTPAGELLKNPGFETTCTPRKNRKGNKYGVWKVEGEHEAAGWSLNDAHPGTFELVASRDGGARSGQRRAPFEKVQR